MLYSWLKIASAIEKKIEKKITDISLSLRVNTVLYKFIIKLNCSNFLSKNASRIRDNKTSHAKYNIWVVNTDTSTQEGANGACTPHGSSLFSAYFYLILSFCTPLA